MSVVRPCHSVICHFKICALNVRYEHQNNVHAHLLQRVGNVRLHMRVLSEDQAGQQGGALLGRQRTQDVLEQQLGQQQLVAADLTSYSAF